MKKLKIKLITLCMCAALLAPINVSAASYYGDNQLDGKVDVFYQGAAPDCGAISAIQALDNSTYGKGLVMHMITVNNDGSYTLNFGSGKVKVTQEDVDNAYVTGDYDARVIEAGLQNAMNVYNSCFACDVFSKITGFKKVQVWGDKARNDLMNTMASRCYAYEGVTAACDFQIADDSKGIIGNGGHSYSIRCVLNDYVVVINPWDTSELIYMTRSQFENSIRYMTYVDERTKQVKVYWR